MIPRRQVDEFSPPWDTFASFFFARDDLDGEFLVELDHERETRRTWTVGAWQTRVAATADWLTVRDVSPGDAVATLAGNSADALVLAYGCWVLGACVVPLNPADSPQRQQYILGDAAAVLLVHTDVTGELAHELHQATGVIAVATSALPQHENGSKERGDAATRLFSGTLDSSGGMAAPALRVYTSGTTGDPKGVILTVANLLTDCDALALRLDWPADTRVITVLPVHHVNGLVISVLLPWYSRFSTVLCDRFRSELFWTDVARERVTVCSVVPSLLEFLLGAPGIVPTHFREFLSGAGPLLVETALDFEQRFSVPIRHLYGLSETTAVVTLMPRLPDTERSRWHREYGFPSIGPPLPHVEVAVLDAQGNTVGATVRGELAARGAVVMREYASQPRATEEAFRGGWFHTGDEGFWEQGPDGQHFFFITGRIKELIIRGGANISPFEVDSVLRSHPAVRHGVAVPFVNRFYGEEIAAYVVRDGQVTEEEILAHCARYLDFARCPKVVVFGDDVPYTATGKVKRLELKQRLDPILSTYRDVQFRRSRTAAT